MLLEQLVVRRIPDISRRQTFTNTFEEDLQRTLRGMTRDQEIANSTSIPSQFAAQFDAIDQLNAFHASLGVKQAKEALEKAKQSAMDTFKTVWKKYISVFDKMLLDKIKEIPQYSHLDPQEQDFNSIFRSKDKPFQDVLANHPDLFKECGSIRDSILTPFLDAYNQNIGRATNIDIINQEKEAFLASVTHLDSLFEHPNGFDLKLTPAQITCKKSVVNIGQKIFDTLQAFHDDSAAAQEAREQAQKPTVEELSNPSPITHNSSPSTSNAEITHLVSELVGNVPNDLNITDMLNNLTIQSQSSSEDAPLNNQAIVELKEELNLLKTLVEQYREANQNDKIELKEQINNLANKISTNQNQPNEENPVGSSLANPPQENNGIDSVQQQLESNVEENNNSNTSAQHRPIHTSTEHANITNMSIGSNNQMAALLAEIKELKEANARKDGILKEKDDRIEGLKADANNDADLLRAMEDAEAREVEKNVFIDQITRESDVKDTTITDRDKTNLEQAQTIRDQGNDNKSLTTDLIHSNEIKEIQGREISSLRTDKDHLNTKIDKLDTRIDKLEISNDKKDDKIKELLDVLEEERNKKLHSSEILSSYSKKTTIEKIGENLSDFNVELPQQHEETKMMGNDTNHENLSEF